MPTLADQYRPRDFESFIGQAKALRILRRIIERPGFDRDAFWIVGPTGTGKTTLAGIIARRFCSETNIIEIDGEACTVEAVRRVAEQMKHLPLFGADSAPWRCWIINEAQAMTSRAVQAWLTTIDTHRLKPRTLVIFTTTDDSADLFGQYDGPFRSRCKTLAFTNQGLAPLIARYASSIADAEELNGKGEKAALALVRECHNNIRSVLQAVEQGALLTID